MSKQSEMKVYLAMLDRVGIRYELEPDTERGTVAVIWEYGYSGFVGVHIFDDDGKLLSVGAYK